MASELTADQRVIQERFVEAKRPKPPPWEPGITFSMPAEQYHVRELGVVSKSALDQLARSPAHYRAWVDGEQKEPTAAQKFGTAFHMALLEPERFKRAYAVMPDFGDLRSSTNRAKRDGWLKERGNPLALDKEDDEAIKGMLDSIIDHPAASRIIQDGIQEVTLRWVDPITGLRCKARADHWVKGKRLVGDLKTTEDASPDEFKRSVTKWRYFVQDCMYRMGFAACGEPIEFFALVAIEKTKPHAVACYTLDADAIAKGYAAARRDMDRLAECLHRNEFPGYSDGIEDMSLPHWAA